MIRYQSFSQSLLSQIDKQSSVWLNVCVSVCRKIFYKDQYNIRFSNSVTLNTGDLEISTSLFLGHYDRNILP